HDRGRSLTEILEDKYVQNRLTPDQQRRLLDRPEMIEAFSSVALGAAKASVSSEPRPPAPCSCASLTASAPSATSQAARPFDLKTTMSSSDCRPTTVPETTSRSSCTTTQPRTPA